MRNLEIHDISAKPKRYQQDSVIHLGEESPPDENTSNIEIPKNVTIEAAISFFETSAEGELEVIYKRTAGWLKILLSTQNRSTTTKSREAIQELIARKQQAKKEENNE